MTRMNGVCDLNGGRACVKRREFRREEWLRPERYGYGPEEAAVVAAACADTDGKWWDVWTERIEETLRLPGLVWVDVLFGRFSGPCVVVGAGPSLDREMDGLRRLVEAGWPVIAVDRAFGTLKRGGVRPDLVVCCDAQPKVADFLEGFDGMDAAAVSVACHGDVAKRAEKGRVYRHAPLNPFSPFWGLAYQRFGERMATLRPGVVVTFTAVDAALWMGFDPIVTLGNDLCYEDAVAMRCDVGEKEVVFVLPDGRVTQKTFLRAARALRFFPRMHPEVRFQDVSGGIAEGWERCDIHELADAANSKGTGGEGQCDGVN